MQRKATITNISLNFDHLPSYAAYLLAHHIEDYTALQISISKELDIPILKMLKNMPEPQLSAFLKERNIEFLTYLANNEAAQQIQSALEKWLANQLPNIDKYDINAEDITHIGYLRKKTFLHFITSYTSDIQHVIALVQEIDQYILAQETASTNTYMSLLKDRIEEHSHYIQKVSNTTPGAIYVFDVVNFKGIYSNHKLKEVLGYDHEQLNTLGPHTITSLIHPEDMQSVADNIQAHQQAKDGDIWTYQFRVKKTEGGYKWIRIYEAVFKRSNEGTVSQTIGIALDIDKEQKTAEQLQQREQQLLEAQEIAQVGSFVWSYTANTFYGTPKIYQLLDAGNDYKAIYNKVHPEDKQQLLDCLENAYKTGHFECEFRYDGKKKLWSKGLIEFQDGKPVTLTGTIMDITERSAILENLRRSEERFKQAEALTHIGNFELDLNSNKVIFSDELYRIYELQPDETSLDYKTIIALRHPDDKQAVTTELQKAIKEQQPFDFYYRTLLKNGNYKILRARGEVIYDRENKPCKLMGTIQDVTTRQTLIEKLKNTEQMYKQAEALANMGNYSMDLTSNEIQWTDQLYLIYGLQPQSEKISLERFYNFIHPDDREKVDISIEQFYKSGTADYTFRIVTKDGTVKTLRSIAQLQYNEKGQPTYVVGTEQDITEHQQLVNKLEQSQRLFEQAQSIAHLGNWRYNVQTRETSWSEELYRIYEIPLTEKISFELFLSFVHPDDKESVLAHYEDCLQKKQPYNKRHRIVLRNGKIKTLQRHGELKLDDKGDVVEIYGTTQDITEQLTIENELREKQNFIEKIANATPSIIASYNINTGAYVFINEGLRKLLGYNPDDLIQKGAAFLTEKIHPDDLPFITEKNLKLLEAYNKPEKRNDNSMIAEFTYRMRHLDGSYKWLQTYGTIFDRNEHGHIEHVLNISLDITQQVESTQKIKDQEHFINQIADASPTILYLYNVLEKRIVYINREIYYVLGYTAEEIVNAGPAVTQMLYHPEDFDLLPERQESIKKFQHHDSMMQYECRMKTKEGEWSWVLVREVIFKTGEQGEILQILGAALDITRRKEMEKTLLQNAFQLEQSNASLEEFAYVASHDLKEPLRKISTFGDRLLNTQIEKLTDEGKIYLKKIVDASQRMQVMINDLLSISMITGDRSFESFSLTSVLEDVLQTLEFKIEQKSAIIKAEPLPEANIVPSQFRQLFQNLLSNSLKFVREGVQPVIHIKHSYVQPDEIEHLQLNKAPGYHKLQFIDNGIGFEEEYSGKIFAIFQRLHGRSEYEGTGIGLAICKKIVEHHGGAIYANSYPDDGATFTIILPA